MIAPIPRHTLRSLRKASRKLFQTAKTEQWRTMAEFMEKELVLPTGPFEGEHFRFYRQPFIRLLIDQIDSGQFNEIATTGPAQSGKSFSCFATPILYHLFERKETVLVGLPDIDMSKDKWREDLLPNIETTRYRKFLPRQGSGSRGGIVEAIKFRHGPTLKFMGGGGNDKTRSGFTTRVLCITELDGLDTTGGGSRESTKIEQLLARTNAYNEDRIVYKECTVSIEQGAIWQEYQQGTRSQILLPCPGCSEYVLPEREHLVGWQEAPDVITARDQAGFVCPNCGIVWTEEQRRAAVVNCRLVHDGQQIDSSGQIHGERKRTNVLGFRWSGVHNLMTTTAELAAREWQAARSVNREAADRKMKQFFWCVPVASDFEPLDQIDPQTIPYRLLKDAPRGVLPVAARQLTVGIDANSKQFDWLALCFVEGAAPHVVDYGTVAHDRTQSLEGALMQSLSLLLAKLQRGFLWKGSQHPRIPDQVWIDSSWESPLFYSAVRQANALYPAASERYRPIKGYGAGQDRNLRYRKPTKTSATVLAIGEAYHFALQPDSQTVLVEIDSNYWKSWFRSRLDAPLDQPQGAPLTLFDDLPDVHRELAQHFTAEEPQQVFDPKKPEKGVVTVWKRLRKANHKLDCAYLACAAGHFCGARLPTLPEEVRPAAEPIPEAPLLAPDGRPFFALNR